MLWNDTAKHAAVSLILSQPIHILLPGKPRNINFSYEDDIKTACEEKPPLKTYFPPSSPSPPPPQTLLTPPPPIPPS